MKPALLAALVAWPTVLLAQPVPPFPGRAIPEAGYQAPADQNWDDLSWEYWEKYLLNEKSTCGVKDLVAAQELGCSFYTWWSRHQPLNFQPKDFWKDNPLLLGVQPRGQSPQALFIGGDPVVPGTSNPGIEFLYEEAASSELVLKNAGHTVELVLDPDDEIYASSVKPAVRQIKFNDVTYRLMNLHFHHPSEHLLQGKRYAMEMHIVHMVVSSSPPKRLVVSVLMELANDVNPALKPLTEAMAGITKKNSTSQISWSGNELLTLLPTNRNYSFYQGSLTTPPCSGGVNWVVLTTPIPVSKAQVDAFVSTLEHGRVNARPLMDYPRVPVEGCNVSRRGNPR